MMTYTNGTNDKQRKLLSLRYQKYKRFNPLLIFYLLVGQAVIYDNYDLVGILRGYGVLCTSPIYRCLECLTGLSKAGPSNMSNNFILPI
jgi:hypothetical protein